MSVSPSPLRKQQRARSYAPDLKLMGVVAAAPPTDLVENLRSGSDPSVRALMTAFTAYSWSQHFGVPLTTLGNRSTRGIINRLAQNPDDGIVNAKVTRTFAKRMCRNGARVHYVSISGKGHETSASDSAKVSLDWMVARFANAPAPSDCGHL